MSKWRRLILVVAGPTASGKSALALALAQAFGGAIINSDSMQLYREFRVLTARPTPADETKAAHRLYGVLAATRPGSAALWREMALAEIEVALAAGRLPILVGGTGLYLRALLEGLAPVPEVPPAVREQVRRRHAELGGIRFHAELGRTDPEMAARLFPGDTQRLIRAAEVVATTGRSLAAWQREPSSGPALPAPVVVLRLLPSRDLLYAAIDARFRHMMAAGALEEVAAFLAQNLPPGLPVAKALGVPELARHLAGEVALEAAIALAQQSTRRYAKRQGTWLKHQIAANLTIEEQYSERILPHILSFIRESLLTAAD